MLTLADSRHLTDVTVFRDVAWGAGSRALTSTFYLLSDAPALALAEDGGPAYAVFCFRGATPAASGGLLTAAITCTPGPSEHDRLAKEIRTAYQLSDEDAVTLAPVPLDAGTVSLAFATEQGAEGDELTSAVLGGGPARQTGDDTTSFAVDLTAEGVALLLASLDQGDKGLALLHATWELAIPYVLDDVSMRVWCDVAAACRATADLHEAGALDPSHLVTALTARQVAGTTRTSLHPLSAAESAALDQLATTVLTDLLPTCLLDDKGAPKPCSTDLEGHLNLTLTATYPATRQCSLAADLALPISTELRSSRISTFDSSADQLLDRFQVTVAGDLPGHGIAAVAVRIDHAGTTSTGAVLARTAEVVLRPANPTAVLALDLASAEQRGVRPHVEVHFLDGSAPYAIDLPETDGTLLELDIDALGVLVVDLALGAVDPAAEVHAVVELSYGDSGRFDATYVLDLGTPTGRWTAPVREVPGAYRRRVTWVLGEKRVAGGWEQDTALTLRLDVPAGLVPVSGTVTFLSAGSFGALQQALVEVRRSDSSPVTVLTFTAPDQSATWTGSELPLAYQTRQTLVLTDGRHLVGSWRPEDHSVQVVRDDLHLEVSLVGRLLDLGGAVRKAVIELQGSDPGAATSTVVLTQSIDQPTCSLRLLDPTDHSYRYRLTLSPVAGPPITTDWLRGTSTVLVLRPPS